MTEIPQSRLTLERPDLWQRALGLATGLTGYSYPHKAPLSDGTILACGYSNPVPYVPPTPEEKAKIEDQRRKKEISDLEHAIKWDKGTREDYRKGILDRQKQIEEMDRIIQRKEDDLKKLKKQYGLIAALSVSVPEGAMEWLLHEVGHWVAATPEEHMLPNYGYGTILCPDDTVLTGTGADREWQSWAFEEIILAPFGPSRSFAPPEHAGGVAFSKNQIPHDAMKHAERRIAAIGLDVDEWRGVYGEWSRWIQ